MGERYQVASIKYQESGKQRRHRKTNGGFYIKFGGSEAFAPSEGLTNVKPKNFAKNLNCFLLSPFAYSKEYFPMLQTATATATVTATVTATATVTVTVTATYTPPSSKTSFTLPTCPSSNLTFIP